MCHAQSLPERLSPQDRYRTICERFWEDFHDKPLADLTLDELRAWTASQPAWLRGEG